MVDKTEDKRSNYMKLKDKKETVRAIQKNRVMPTGKTFSKDYQPVKNGSPKGKRLTTILKELLSNDISKIDSNLRGLKINEALALKLLTLALHKDVNPNIQLNAIKEIADRTEGKAIQTIIANTTPVQPIEIINNGV